MQFCFYVLNYDSVKQEVAMFNIFRNKSVQEYAEREVKRYIRSPNQYSIVKNGNTVYGIEALCKSLAGIIMWQEWSRREYEISAGDAFETDLNKYKKIDCYTQAIANIETIAYECVRQYREQKKKG